MNQIAQFKNISIRRAMVEDAQLILDYVLELAKIENSKDKVTNKIENIKKYGFGKDAIFKTLILEVEKKSAGFALYYNRYSTWVGKTIEIEDIYVSPKYRKLGIGTKVFGLIAQEALDTDCSRLEWQVYHQEVPSAVNFYEKFGTHFEKRIWRCQLNGANEIQRLIDFSNK